MWGVSCLPQGSVLWSLVDAEDAQMCLMLAAPHATCKQGGVMESSSGEEGNTSPSCQVKWELFV